MESMNQQLVQACHDGDLAAVQMLLKDGADPKAADVHGEDAFHLAFDMGHEEIAIFLAAHGAGNMAEAYAHRKKERGWALDKVGVTAHDVKMRMRGRCCVVCSRPMNFMRFFRDKKHFCMNHEDADKEMLHAIETVSAM